MRAAYSVAQVRAAEEALMRRVPEGALMQRAATGLARTCAALVRDRAGRVPGSRVVLLVGSGNNGGDALWAGAFLARRGARVDAVLLSTTPHPEGLAALTSAGGRVVRAGTAAAVAAVGRADVVVDGIVGIGGTGALRAEAAELVAAARGLVVAVDVPSGVSADTGAVADVDAVVTADVTVTFGCLKPGLLVAPGRDRVGVLELVDIGLGPLLPPDPVARVLAPSDVAALVPAPRFADHKYSRGVVGVAAGSARYPGAALLATGGARRGDVGMVRYLDRGDGLARTVVEHLPDVVTQADPLADPRVDAWACGPGLGTDDTDRAAALAVLATPGPAVLDADALRVVADPDGRAAVGERARHGRATVVTPHVGEFARLGFEVGQGADEDRLGAALAAARALDCVVLLKGPGTVVAAPDGTAYVDPSGSPALATAGSGDVLTGLLGAMLAGAVARGDLVAGGGAPPVAAGVAAGAAFLHGLAGAIAASGGRPVAAADLVDALPTAVASVRDA